VLVKCTLTTSRWLPTCQQLPARNSATSTLRAVLDPACKHAKHRTVLPALPDGYVPS
jgi:hypothetical protein